MNNTLGKYTTLLCEAIDGTVLHDLEDIPNLAAVYKTIPVYAVGWQQELAAGLRGGTLTKWCKSMEDLETEIEIVYGPVLDVLQEAWNELKDKDYPRMDM